MLFEKKKPEDKPWPPASAPDLTQATGGAQSVRMDGYAAPHPLQVVSSQKDALNNSVY